MSGRGTEAKAYVTTSRMVLRQFSMADVDLLYELDGDPEVMRFLDRKRPSREFIQHTFLPHILRAYDELPGFGVWAAIDNQSGNFLGWFSLRVQDAHARSSAELGYRLRRQFWGIGLATEGSRALIDRAFGELGVERIWAQTMAVNAGSRRVMEKCGLRLVRTFYLTFDDPLPGTGQGEVEYEILREDWVAAQGMSVEC